MPGCWDNAILDVPVLRVAKAAIRLPTWALTCRLSDQPDIFAGQSLYEQRPEMSVPHAMLLMSGSQPPQKWGGDPLSANREPPVPHVTPSQEQEALP